MHFLRHPFSQAQGKSLVTNVAVIGVGSPQGADRFGWQVIEYLTNEIKLETLAPGKVRLESSDRPGAVLLDMIKGTDLALIVDAVAGGEADRLVRLDKQELLTSDNNLSSHSFGVAEALALGQVVDMLPPNIVLYGVQTGEQTSVYTPSRQAVVAVGDAIRQEIQEQLNLTAGIH